MAYPFTFAHILEALVSGVYIGIIAAAVYCFKTRPK
jgi:hypothetical protein